MKPALEALQSAYAAALEEYLNGGEERALNHAYGIGRQAVAQNLGLLELAAVHGQALIALSSEKRARDDVIGQTQKFFAETLAPFEMAQRGFQEANQTLRAVNDVLRRKNHELVQAKDNAEQLSRELEAFAYSVSHDLRAPLRAVDGFSEALREECGEALGARGHEHLARVQSGVKRMNALIEDLLALAQVTRSQLHLATIDLATIARRVEADLRQSAPGRRVDFVVRDGLLAEADPQLTLIVFENLLGNAFKFTSKKAAATIEVGATEADGEVVFFVRDDGAGFDAAYGDKLFSPFQRLHAVEDFVGTGIGLATVQRIIRRHGGRIWGEGAVGRGAVFYFTLSPKR